MSISFNQICSIFWWVVFSSPVFSEEWNPNFSLPLNCSMGIDCFIQNHVDRDEGSGERDYHCGFLTYEGHSGTDFRVRDLKLGVNVLAALDGIVSGMRDGMDDINVRQLNKLSLIGREAGNVVVLDHGHGWESIYAHMLKGSVTVQVGQRVARGQVLGKIGLSGNTEFPHVHFETKLKGKSIDPFAGIEGGEACRLGQKPLWSSDALPHLDYISTGVLEASFSSGDIPETLIADDAKQINFSIKLFGVQKNDIQSLDIYGPSNQLLTHNENIVPGNKAELSMRLALVPSTSRWQSGEYFVSYSLLRDKKPLIEKRFSVRVVPTH